MPNISCCGCGCGTALPAAVISGLANFRSIDLPADAPPGRDLVLRAIRAYQVYGTRRAECHFRPSCSVYAREAFLRFGFVKASAKTAWRLLRCNPFRQDLHDDPL